MLVTAVPYPWQTTRGCFTGLGDNLISGLLAHSQPSGASAKTVGPLGAPQLGKGVGGLLVPRNISWEGP